MNETNKIWSSFLNWKGALATIFIGVIFIESTWKLLKRIKTSANKELSQKNAEKHSSSVKQHRISSLSSDTSGASSPAATYYILPCVCKCKKCKETGNEIRKGQSMMVYCENSLLLKDFQLNSLNELNTIVNSYEKFTHCHSTVENIYGNKLKCHKGSNEEAMKNKARNDDDDDDDVPHGNYNECDELILNSIKIKNHHNSSRLSYGHHQQNGGNHNMKSISSSSSLSSLTVSDLDENEENHQQEHRRKTVNEIARKFEAKDNRAKNLLNRMNSFRNVEISKSYFEGSLNEDEERLHQQHQQQQQSPQAAKRREKSINDIRQPQEYNLNRKLQNGLAPIQKNGLVESRNNLSGNHQISSIDDILRQQRFSRTLSAYSITDLLEDIPLDDTDLDEIINNIDN